MKGVCVWYARPSLRDTAGQCAGGTHPTGMHSCVKEHLPTNINKYVNKYIELFFKQNTKLDGYAGPICPFMNPLSRDNVKGKTDFRITCLIIVQLPEPIKNEVVVHKFHESNLPIDEQFA